MDYGRSCDEAGCCTKGPLIGATTPEGCTVVCAKVVAEYTFIALLLFVWGNRQNAQHVLLRGSQRTGFVLGMIGWLFQDSIWSYFEQSTVETGQVHPCVAHFHVGNCFVSVAVVVTLQESHFVVPKVVVPIPKQASWSGHAAVGQRFVHKKTASHKASKRQNLLSFHFIVR